MGAGYHGEAVILQRAGERRARPLDRSGGRIKGSSELFYLAREFYVPGLEQKVFEIWVLLRTFQPSQQVPV